MAVDDVYQLTLIQSYGAQRVQNTLAFRKKNAGDPIQTDCFDLASDWFQAFKVQQNVGIDYVGWRMQQVNGGTVSYVTNPCTRDGGLLFDGTFTAPLNGNISGDGMPPQCAIVTTLRTAFSGRRRRGRYYMAGWSEVGQAYGTVASAYVTSLQTLWNAQLVKFGPTGTSAMWQLGVWSTRVATGCSPAAAHPHAMTSVDTPSPTTAFTPVIGTVVRPIVYTQRRRTIGVGS